MKYYDSQNKRILVTSQAATPSYWNRRWSNIHHYEHILNGIHNHFVIKITKRYLSQGLRILDGGCGPGQIVYALSMQGYETYGVDTSDTTIQKTHYLFPSLNLTIQDVRKLNFSDSYFDGYWSIGVIEHFQEGFHEILIEMKRILKKNGYLFLTFPYMSPFRRLKARLNLYPRNPSPFPYENFYQYILKHSDVGANFVSQGFILVDTIPYDPISGLESEIGLPKYISKGHHFIDRCFRGILSVCLRHFAGHSILLILKKT